MKRLKRSYVLQVDDPSRLVTVMSVRLKVWQMILAMLGCVALAVGVAFILLLFTPVREVMPGYLPEEQRDITIERLLRIDSLSQECTRHEQYVANLLTVLDTDRELPDSLPADGGKFQLSNSERLMKPGERENRFVAAMRQQEKYSLSVLAPLETTGMSFSSLSPGAVMSEASRDNLQAEMLIARDAPVCAVTRAVVVDTHYSGTGGGYVVVLQHPKGFVSRMTGVGRPLVEEGTVLEKGDVVSYMPDMKGYRSNVLRLELWRNGEAMVPGAFLK